MYSNICLAFNLIPNLCCSHDVRIPCKFVEAALNSMWRHTGSDQWTDVYRIIIHSVETAHLPLPKANINTYFLRREKY